MAFDADALLDAAGGDRQEALRMLFAVARRAADAPATAPASGAELAAALASLVGSEATSAAHRMATQAGGALGAAPTAATVADAIEEVLTGASLTLPDDAARYDQAELLGAGGMGQVLRVVDRRLGRTVARKELHAGVTGLASARRFLAEAKLTAQLDHPNIVPLYDLGQAPDGRLYFTMKEVEGRSLAQCIDDVRHGVRRGERDAHPAILTFARWFRQVCDGVAFAHDQGVAHRDLKPDNVMIGDFGEVQVMDWGLAARFGDPLTGLEGTPAYLAPEVVDGACPRVGPAVDIYALGATLYHLLCFERPYAGPAEVVLAQRRAGSPAPPSSRVAHAIPPELEAVALRAMADRPDARHGSVRALGDDVQAWLDGRPVASLSYGRTALLAKWVGRNRRLVAAVGATVAVAGVLGVAGGARYVTDVTAQRDRARKAETLALERLVEAQLAAARASTETGRFGRAEALYDAAADELVALGGSMLGVSMGRLDNHARAERPAFAVAPPEEGTLRIEPVQGAVYRVVPGEPVVLRRPPTFEALWRSGVPVPACAAESTRWERGTLALYCATDAGVRRVDLADGTEAPVVGLRGEPPLVHAPPGSSLVFVGRGDADDLHGDPNVRWLPAEPGPLGWSLGPELDVAEIPSAAGPWFLADRYGAHGTVLHHMAQGPVRTVGRPRARGVLSPDGRWAATYHEGRHELLLEPLEGGPEAWSLAPERPLVAHGFTPDLATLLVASSTGPTVTALAVADGRVEGTYDGHDGAVLEVVATADLVLSRGQTGDVLGYPRHPLPATVAGSVMGLLPPGDVLVLGDGDALVFVDVATRSELRRVHLEMLADDEPWEAESLTADGALVVTTERLLFVPFAPSPVVELARSDGQPLASGDRTDDGHVAFCRGRDVVLRTPDGEEETLGRLEQGPCRDLQLAGPDRVFVSDFWGFALHRFARGTTGPVWTATHDNVVYRVSVEGDRVAVGDLTGQVSVYDTDTGASVVRARPLEGPVLGCALSPSGRYVAAAGWDHRVAVVDLVSGDVVAEDQRHGVPVEWVAWSRDEARLVSADPASAIVRELRGPAARAEARRRLTTLAESPDAPRSPEEQGELAQALAAFGWWEAALMESEGAAGLSKLEQARWLWQAGRGAEAAEVYAEARPATPTEATYLSLCAAPAR